MMLAAAEHRCSVKFLTLTQRARPEESALAARCRIVGHWGKLRRSVQWRAWQGEGGGIARVEATWNAGDVDGKPRGWHFHLHVLAQLAYVPQAELAALWAKVTKGDGIIVDIRMARGDVAGELLKYVVKAATLPDAQLVEYAQTMRGRRDLSTFGRCYGKGDLAVMLRQIESAEDAPLEMGGVGDVVTLRVAELERRADGGDEWARRAVLALDQVLSDLARRATERAERARVRARAGPSP